MSENQDNTGWKTLDLLRSADACSTYFGPSGQNGSTRPSSLCTNEHLGAVPRRPSLSCPRQGLGRQILSCLLLATVSSFVLRIALASLAFVFIIIFLILYLFFGVLVILMVATLVVAVVMTSMVVMAMLICRRLPKTAAYVRAAVSQCPNLGERDAGV